MSGLTIDEIRRVGDIPLNFVSGKERSGTTLLQVMLNTHPNIVAPPESRFIMILHSRYGKVMQWTEKNLTRFCNDIMKEKAIKDYWAINRDDLLASFLTAKDVATYPLLCKLVFYHASQGKDVKMFFDKNPIYAYFMPELKRFFPDAKYIHIVRDYRANIMSHRRVFMLKRITDITYRWLKMNMLIEAAKSSNLQGYFTLKYENLVSEPVKSITDICKFLSVPFYEKMAVQHSSGIYPGFNANQKKRFRAIHQSLFTPLTASFVDKWEKALTPLEIAQAESIAGDYAEKMYGYKKHSTRLASGTMLSIGLMTKLRYQAINKMYLFVFNTPALYFAIRTYIWKYI
jgi:hypothetical protein